MKLVFRANDVTEAHIVAGMLNAAGIETHVGGHYLQGGVGDLAVMGFANVFVADDDVDLASELIAGYDHAGTLTRKERNMPQTSAQSAVWSHHVTVPDTPEGFTVRTTYPANPDGVEVMLEQWEAGSAEPPHSHPGDDMTVVVEGRMAVQFYTRGENGLVPDGEPLVLNRGDTGYIEAGRIHDARYLEPCKLVYVHDRAFGFVAED